MSQIDALKLLRQSIASSTPPITTTSAIPATAAEPALSQATHLQFVHVNPPIVFALDTPTRFESTSSGTPTPVDLRSIYLAWLKKDVAITDYISQCQALTDELNAHQPGKEVKNLVFAEKLDLITWLEGASSESEYIQPLDGDDEDDIAAHNAAGVASGAHGGIDKRGPTGTASGRLVDQRLHEIYNAERRMADHNSILRGIKPTDFSHIRKHAEIFLGRNRNRTLKQSSSSIPASLPNHSAARKSHTQSQPIILLSPSASSLLRMSNVKSFLEVGTYEPPDSAAGTPNLLYVQRLMPSINPQRPFRFILVDSPDQFKPDYWNRVAAVFTTGQTWQFKSYKWQSPPDLFSHALGLYIGWRGEEIPPSVKGWGRGVMSTQIDKYNAHQGPQGRWRDREVVEGIWTAIEESMRNKGWGKDSR